MVAPSTLWRCLLLAAVGFVCSVLQCGAARAQEVGTVVTLRGAVDIGRGGSSVPAVNGMPVQLGDEVRTGADGRATLTFQDGTVLSVGDQSRGGINEQVCGGTEGPSRSGFRLLQGLVRSVVTAYYGQPDSSYEIETPTAVAGVRGTQFIVAYDPGADVTDVVGIDGQVAVNGTAARSAPPVLVTAGQRSTVPGGRGPMAPVPVPEQRFRQYLDAVAFAGAGLSAGTSSFRVMAPDKPRARVSPPDEDAIWKCRASTCALGGPAGGGGLRINFP
jgi:hypothetical protein